MSQKSKRRRERQSVDEPERDDEGIRYGQAEIGRIVALASELQMRERASESSREGLDHEQLVAMAAQLGIELRHVETALELARVNDRGMPIDGSIEEVRGRLTRHFAGVSLALPMEGSTAGRVSIEDGGAVCVDWQGRTLRMELHEGPAGKTLVSWDAQLDPQERKMLGTKVGGGILGVLAAIAVAAGGNVIAGLFAAVLLVIYAVEKIEMNDNERQFIEFCRTHLDNVQLVARG
ncbi:MAG: hypothetical protein HY816_14540 [Candidatus Wallbacteria bacterium]|nr:hypothetical protein [Candidatus Wallbacteria bacterium]